MFRHAESQNSGWVDDMKDKINNGGPAYPVADLSKTQCWGMSLRDAMALSVSLPDDYSAKWGAALIGEQQPIPEEPVAVHIDWWMRVEAAYRYRLADAMIRARTQDASHE